MPNYQIGQTFVVHFVWRLPDDDYIRALFEAQVVDLAPKSEKYIVRLQKLVGGRQETPTGEQRPKSQMSLPYWAMVRDIVGQKVSLAYEAADGRPLHMRLATLTREHNFFYRYAQAEAALADKLP